MIFPRRVFLSPLPMIDKIWLNESTKMWLHQHPFELFLPKEATHLTVGTLPPPRFFYGDLKSGDVPFCYGSIDGQLWPILDRIYSLDLRFENSAAAVQERKTFLTQINMGICDIVAHCYRKNGTLLIWECKRCNCVIFLVIWIRFPRCKHYCSREGIIKMVLPIFLNVTWKVKD